MSFADLISEIRQKGNDGKAFEVFCKWFLLNDPYWKTQVDEVWLWDDWPQRWDRDKGVDLVFRHKNGEMWAVQSKCYAETTRITKEDVDSFLTDSNRKIISKRLLMASTNALGRNAIETMAGQEKPVIRWMLDDFENSAIVYPLALSELNKSAETKEHEDRPYQLEAVEAVVEGLNSHERGQLIMACGTGKTFVTLWIKERLKPQTCLVLLPSLSLLSQTLHEWTANCKDEFEVLCVCSDTTVGKRNTNEDLRISEAPFDVTSDPDVIRTFLKQSRPKVIFCTYQSSELIGKAQRNSVIDLVVCDEAHRCAGPATASFTKVLDNKFIKAKKRLFTTATPRVFSKATVKSADARGQEIYGMDDETVFGPILHTYSFGQAIEDKWLTDYQVLIVGVDEPTISSYIETREIVGSTEAGIVSDAETLASKLSLLKATAEYDLKRVISFHGRVKAARDFASEYSDLIDLVEPSKRPKGLIWTDFVSGEMSAGDRKQKIHKLKKLSLNERGLLANARCLSEGVDVPSLDGVAFIDPKGSQIDIIQAVGRALRKSDEKKFGTIILPVFIEPGDNEIERIESSNFKPVWDVLKALRSHDERLGESIDGIRNELGKRHKSRKTLPDNIIFDLPISVGIEFSEALRTTLIESVSESWHFWFGLLSDFHAVNGNCLVLDDFITIDGHKLGKWVGRQRTRRAGLSEERVAQLDDIGFVWDVADAYWKEGLSQLVAFKAKCGHCLVTPRHKTEDGFKLGSWVVQQRQKRATMTENRKIALDEIGFVWEPYLQRWEEGFLNLIRYEKENSHCTVPKGHINEAGYKLGDWVDRQRQRKQYLPKAQVNRLDELGFVWDPYGNQWEIGFSNLELYKSENGDCNVPAKFIAADDFKLGNWVGVQRTTKQKLGTERIARLDELGFVWEPLKNNWDVAFGHLTDFFQSNRHCLVPRHFVTATGFKLGYWVGRQRDPRNKLSTDRIKRLDSLGFVWNTLEAQWEEGYRRLYAFKEKNGHCRVPQTLVSDDGFKLGSWVGKQRGRKAKLTDSRLNKLESIGFVWDPHEALWEEGFTELTQFFEANRHSVVPSKFVTENGHNLGDWVVRQRGQKEKLSLEKVRRLDECNFIWNTIDAKWDEGFNHLINYSEAFGNCRVPKAYLAADGYRLGAWVSRQRGALKTMDEGRKKKLDELGFVWVLN